MRRCFSRTVTRLASVGWAVITGRTRSTSSSFRSSLGGDLGGGRAGDHLGKGAPHLVIAPVGFGLPPPAHGRILLGDAQQLEPEPLHLKSSGQQVGAQVGGGTLSAQYRLQLGLPLPNQTQQQSGEKLDDLVGVCGRAGGGRISRLGKTDG